MIDSAGYNIPHDHSWRYDSLVGTDTSGIVYTSDSIVDDELDLFEHFDSRAEVQSTRLTGYVERSQLFEKNGHDFFLNIGLRSHYWTFNGQNVISPRASFSWKPDWESAWPVAFIINLRFTAKCGTFPVGSMKISKLSDLSILYWATIISLKSGTVPSKWLPSFITRILTT